MNWRLDDIEQTVLEQLKVRFREEYPEEMLAMMETAELARFFMDHTYRMALELRAYVQAERLAPEEHHLTFKRSVPVADYTITGFRMPANWWDHWKFNNQKWARRFNMKPVRWVVTEMRHSPTKRMEEVKVSERVTIERHNTYPNSRYVLPAGKFGHPVYVETVRYG